MDTSALLSMTSVPRDLIVLWITYRCKLRIASCGDTPIEKHGRPIDAKYDHFNQQDVMVTILIVALKT